MAAFWLWSIGALIAAGYCIVRGIGDLRRKDYLMGTIGIGSAAIFLLTPIKTQAVKIDLPLVATR